MVFTMQPIIVDWLQPVCSTIDDWKMQNDSYYLNDLLFSRGASAVVVVAADAVFLQGLIVVFLFDQISVLSLLSRHRHCTEKSVSQKKTELEATINKVAQNPVQYTNTAISHNYTHRINVYNTPWGYVCCGIGTYASI